MKIPVSFHLTGLLLLEIAAITACNGDFVLTTDDHRVVTEMCQAQHKARLGDLQVNHASVSYLPDNFNNATWLLNCTQSLTNQTGANCEGTCSFLATEKGYVPEQPNVEATRNNLTRHLEFSWIADPRSTSVIYVIASKQPNVTDSRDIQQQNVTDRSANIEFLEVVNASYRLGYSDICWTPEVRVAAVSPYGSKWFTDAVEIPDLIPGPPQHVNLTDVNYNPMVDIDFVYYTLEWLPPVGWFSQDLLLEHKIEHTTVCETRPVLHPNIFVVDPFIEFHADVPSAVQIQGAFSVTGRIPVDAIGCNVSFSIRAISRCSEILIGQAAVYEFHLGCDKVPGYDGGNCGAGSVVVPGPVSDVRLMVVPARERLTGLVSWRPPDSLGSFSKVDVYHVFWGIMDLMNSDPISSFTSLLGNVTIPGTELGVSLDLNVTWTHAEETVGVMVTAAGQGQIVDIPISDIFLPVNGITSATILGTLIKEDESIYVVQVEADETTEVTVYWSHLHVADPDNMAVSYDIQWGLLADVDNSSTNHSEDFTPTNTTRVQQAYLPLHDVLGHVTYGVKIVPVFNTSSQVLADSDIVWNHTALHIFTVLPGHGTPRVRSTPTLSNIPPATVSTEVPGLNSMHLTALVTSAALASVGALLVYLLLRHRRQRLGMVGLTDPEHRQYTIFSPGTSVGALCEPHCTLVADEWELPLSCVKFGQVLGSGAFGHVVKGQVTRAMLTHRGVASLLADGGLCAADVNKVHATVAIKMLQENCDSKYKQDFLKEIQLMKTLGHHRNVVSMLGCCTLRDPICLIVEHAEFGDLLNYLKNVRHNMMAMFSVEGDYVNKNTDIVSSQDLIGFACQVALGMEFLASKGFVHRDLAARNVLVCADRICKIGDFGLARYIYDNVVYVNRRGGRLPVKWMSVEAIFDMSFSTASDVWSFGVLLYEIVTLGGTPYPTIPTRDLLRELQSGYRMEKPETCSSQVYQMMVQCWQTSPSDRPTFTLLSQWLQTMLEDTSETEYLDIKLNVDGCIYKADDDSDRPVGEDQALIMDRASINHSESSDYPRVSTTECPGASILCHKSWSGDSGYSSPPKQSVSSGESTVTIATADTRSWAGTLPRSDLPTNFSNIFSEEVVDNVFHEENAVVEDDTNVSSGRDGDMISYPYSGGSARVRRQQRRGQELGYQLASENGSQHSRHQSLPDVTLPGQAMGHVSHPRRNSDTGCLTSSNKLKQELLREPCGRDTLDAAEMFHKDSQARETGMPRGTKKSTGNRQRRKAVVIPPTLALDNELYLAAREVSRQNPPVVSISRRQVRNLVSAPGNGDIWTADGQFSFRRSDMTCLQVDRRVCTTVDSEMDTPAVVIRRKETPTIVTREVQIPPAVSREIETPAVVTRETESPTVVTREIESGIFMTHETETPSSVTYQTETPPGPNSKHWNSSRLNNSCTVHVEVGHECPADQEESVLIPAELETRSCWNSLGLSYPEPSQEKSEDLLHPKRQSLRAPKTFAKSQYRLGSKDTPRRVLTRPRTIVQHGHVYWPRHQYADFQNIVKQSTNPRQASAIPKRQSPPDASQLGGLTKQLSHLQTLTDPANGKNFCHFGANRLENILNIEAKEVQDCKDISHCTSILGCLPVRRTYSSPKEDTLVENNLCRDDLLPVRRTYSSPKEDTLVENNLCRDDLLPVRRTYSSPKEDTLVENNLCRDDLLPVRRTYSSPKEDTLVENNLCRDDLHRHKDNVCSLFRRRLSDPFTGPDAAISRHSEVCQRTALPQMCHDQSFRSSELVTCFRLPHSRRRKDTSSEHSRCPLDSPAKKMFPQEKHPAALYLVSSPDITSSRLNVDITSSRLNVDITSSRLNVDT